MASKYYLMETWGEINPIINDPEYLCLQIDKKRYDGIFAFIKTMVTSVMTCMMIFSAMIPYFMKLVGLLSFA